MLKYMVVSDSHNPPTYLERVAARFREEKCDGMIHLGDLVGDAKELEKLIGMPVEYVAGNCDYFAKDRREAVLFKEGVRVLLTHGDAYGVKYSYDRLSYAASEMNVQVALFGHTHEPFAGFVGDVMLVNPGALKKGRYAILELENGRARPFLKSLL